MAIIRLKTKQVSHTKLNFVAQMANGLVTFFQQRNRLKQKKLR